MIALVIIILAFLASYFWIGWRYVGPRYVLREMTRQIREYPRLAAEADYVAGWRKTASAEAWGVAVIWPLCLLAWLFTGKLAIRAPLTDFEAKQKADAQAARIADLERQLGIRK